MRVRTPRSGRAESGQVVEAEHPPDMAMAAGRPVPAEPSVVPWTVANLGLRINVQEWALFVVASI
jgi:hypothetical protein